MDIDDIDILLGRTFHLTPLVKPHTLMDYWMPHNYGQREFLTCPVFEVLAEGNRGGGKTETLLMDFAQHLYRGHGRAWRGLLLKRTFPELTDVIIKSQSIFPLLWPDARFVASPFPLWTWPGGESLRLGYAERESDYWQYHGSEYPWIGWEELSNHKLPDVYLRFMSLCRTSRAGLPRNIRATTNPYGPGHDWIKSRWRLPAMSNKIIIDPTGKEHSRVSVCFKRERNTNLMDNDPEYLKALLSGAPSEGLLKAWRDGDWNISEGGMFSDIWSTRWNTLPDFTPPVDWYVDRAYDDGSSSPYAVGWFAESPGTDLRLPDGRVMTTVPGDVFMIGEYYGARENVATHKWQGVTEPAGTIARNIVQWEIDHGLHGRVRPGPADSSIYDNDHGVTIATDLSQPVTIGGKIYAGAYFQRADKAAGTRKAGWKQLREMILNARPLNGRREKPGLFICRSCVHWLRTVPTLTRKEKDLDDVDHPEDHMGDMTRYRIHNPPRRLKVRAVKGTF